MNDGRCGSGDWQGPDDEGYAKVLCFYRVNNEQAMIWWNHELNSDTIRHACEKVLSGSSKKDGCEKVQKQASFFFADNM